MVNHSPEPFSNIALSLAEDLAAPVGLWVVMQHPLIALGVVAMFSLVFALLAPRIWRLVRLEGLAVRGMFRHWFGNAEERSPDVPAAARSNEKVRALWDVMSDLGATESGLECAATASIKDLKRSPGVLRMVGDELIFTTRRMFRERTYTIPVSSIRGGRSSKGLFLNELGVYTTDGDVKFDVFKNSVRPAPVKRAEAVASRAS